jgi:hypothetical protein
MVFVCNETRSGDTAALDRAVPGSDRAFRWIAVFGAGAAVASLSLATLAGFVFLATSLTSPADFAPHAQKAATPDKLALAAALYAPKTRRDCQSGCVKPAQYIVQQAKSPRRTIVTDKHIDIAWLAQEKVTQRFEQAHASLTPGKLASAFTKAKTMAAALEASASSSLKDRFYPNARVASLPDPNGPVTARFGQRVPEVERSSRLALALAGSGTIQVAYPVQTASLGSPVMPLLLQEPGDSATETAEAPASAFDLMPENAPLPARRPKIRNAPAAIAEAAPATPEAAPSQPAKLARQTNTPTRRGSQQQELAYAAPGDDAPSVGQAFKNLFSSPGAGNGVAVYDISAQTVTMPNGQVLEAHSGVGHMADDPRYANQKMNGPTPPNTYKLVMRESRFHGVEAIRMLPVNGKNKYGRDGILAHSYLLRGRPGQSHGCVAFANYDRFLKAFKQGKVKQIVVVPGRSRSSTRIAKNGQGA